MWKFTWTHYSTIALYLIILILYALQICVAVNAKNYFLENSEAPSVGSNENVGYQPEFPECYITVKEIRRIPGQCVKFRNNFQGCVAGSLMDPFHQDCLEGHAIVLNNP